MTIRVNRDIVLKSLLNKVREAKKLNMTDVKYPLKELEDLAYVVYQLMSEDISKILALKDPPEEKPKKLEKKKERKVLEEIREEDKQVEQEPEKKEEPKPKYEKYVPQEVPSPVKIDQETEEEDDDSPIGGLYGGTW